MFCSNGFSKGYEVSPLTLSLRFFMVFRWFLHYFVVFLGWFGFCEVFLGYTLVNVASKHFDCFTRLLIGLVGYSSKQTHFSAAPGCNGAVRTRIAPQRAGCQ